MPFDDDDDDDDDDEEEEEEYEEEEKAILYLFQRGCNVKVLIQRGCEIVKDRLDNRDRPKSDHPCCIVLLWWRKLWNDVSHISQQYEFIAKISHHFFVLK